jgi:glycosyltransferase involved in cell wall biosynthesis
VALPSVSVVMATYNRRDRLRPVAEALLADPALTELVVVVDGSDDGSLELLEELARADDRLRPVWIENAGASRAQQHGLEQATADVVLMFDDDQLAGPGLVTGHARHHVDRRGVVVVGYTPTAVPAARIPGRFVVALYARSFESDCRTWERDPNTILTSLWGGNLSMRRDDLLRVGWLSDDFDLRYHYDHDFGLRCRAAGLTAVFDRALRAEHLYTRSVDAFLREAEIQGAAILRLHGIHPDLPDFYHPLDVGGRPWETLLRLFRRRRFAALAERPFRAALAAATRLPERVEQRLGTFLWAVQAQKGMIRETERLRAAG